MTYWSTVTIWHFTFCPASCLPWFWTPAAALTPAIGTASSPNFQEYRLPIITYDRAGFGTSDEVPPPYRIEDAVTDLESGLSQLGVAHGLVLISHSYAGTIATYLAMRHPDWISGAVLVDTNVPEFFTDKEVAHMGPIIQLMVAEEAATHPSKQTRTLKAITDAYFETSRAFHKAAWPVSIPCAVIVSDRTPSPQHDLRYRSLDSGPQGLRRQSTESNAYFRHEQFARHCP